MPTNRSVILFVQKYSKVLPFPTFFFVCGSVAYMSAVVYTGYIMCTLCDWPLARSATFLCVLLDLD